MWRASNVTCLRLVRERLETRDQIPGTVSKVVQSRQDATRLELIWFNLETRRRKNEIGEEWRLAKIWRRQLAIQERFGDDWVPAAREFLESWEIRHGAWKISRNLVRDYIRVKSNETSEKNRMQGNFQVGASGNDNEGKGIDEQNIASKE